MLSIEKENGKRLGGGLRFLAGCTQEGGGSFRCVLCATGGGGGVQKSGKNAYVINGRPHTFHKQVSNVSQDVFVILLWEF